MLECPRVHAFELRSCDEYFCAQAKSSVLDFASGSGVITAALTHRDPSLDLHMLDADAVALRAATKNVPDAV